MRKFAPVGDDWIAGIWVAGTEASNMGRTTRRLRLLLESSLTGQIKVTESTYACRGPESLNKTFIESVSTFPRSLAIRKESPEAMADDNDGA